MTDTDDRTVDAVAAAAAASARIFARTAARARADLLDAIASGLEEAGDELVAVAARESRLTHSRLESELDRTAYQLRAFGQLVTAGRHVRAVIEHADSDYPIGGPAPDLRSMLHPVGPVAVFAASNFPFAFSVAGGDTASALAAGCPVVVKAHPGHPELSRATASIVRAALAELGFEPGVFALVEGERAGVRLLQHPAVTAAAFTGSTVGGRVLFDIAAARPTPIPFYGELGSVNPVIVTAEALAARGSQIPEGFVGSFTLGSGQFCTKPGIVFVPAGSGFVAAAAEALDRVAPAPLLNERIQGGYDERGALFTGTEGVDTVRGGGSTGEGERPALYRTDFATFLAHRDALTEERFGPSALVVEYGVDQLVDAARSVPGTLTWTVQAATVDDVGVREVIDEIREHSGRLVYNGWPTGVTVSPAMMHGGPYPASTSSRFTSVGAAAIDRFLRPVAYQNFPDELLPAELSEANPLGVPREVDAVRKTR
jgi:NADP-dependent aldehyde dehydrogenase